MRILVLDPNTSSRMTDEIRAAAVSVARCASVRACGLGTADVDADPAAAVDGVAAAVALAQAVVGLGLSTSKAGVFAPGPPNARTHWPLSAELGVAP